MTSFFETKAKEYISYIEHIRGYSPLTVKSYRAVLIDALKSLSIKQDCEIYKIDLISYRSRLINQSKKSIYKKVSIIRSFVSYLRDQGMVIKLTGDESIKLPSSLPKPLSTTHLMEAIERCSIEERVLIYMLYALGLRISEVETLKRESISDRWVSVKGKGGKIRQLPMLDELQSLLKEFERDFGVGEYLFEKDGKPLTQNQLRYRVEKIFKKIGIKATPHQLRHSFATDLLNRGARITDVSELLGHSSLSTTQIYTKLSNSSKMKNYKSAHPLCWSEDESS